MQSTINIDARNNDILCIALQEGNTGLQVNCKA
jgi:hypothetical protein